MFGIRVFKYLIKIPTIVFCVAFVVLNMQETTLNTPLTTITLPLWMLGIALFSFGFIVGALLLWLNSWPLKKELRAIRKDLKNTEKERNDLEIEVRENASKSLASLDDDRQIP